MPRLHVPGTLPALRQPSAPPHPSSGYAGACSTSPSDGELSRPFPGVHIPETAGPRTAPGKSGHRAMSRRTLGTSDQTFMLPFLLYDAIILESSKNVKGSEEAKYGAYEASVAQAICISSGPVAARAALFSAELRCRWRRYVDTARTCAADPRGYPAMQCGPYEVRRSDPPTGSGTGDA